MLSQGELNQIREELDSCNRPLFFFDDDPDGLCSFLLLYRYKREGRGVPVKSAPKLDEKFLPIINSYQPDKIFIVDVPMIDEDFIDTINVPIVWIDHHGPEKIILKNKVKYFNPRLKNLDDNSAVTINCYYAVGSPEDIWIAMAGSIGDWQIPQFKKEFCEKYTELVGDEAESQRPEVFLFSTRLGALIKILSFMLKGKTKDVIDCIKTMIKIESPSELLEGTTPRGRFILKQTKKIEEFYNELLENAKKSATKGSFLVFTYKDNKMSFTKELSNELLFLYPKKIIFVGREKSGEMKLSIRSSELMLPPVIEKALEGVDGYGGGHEHACGACVKMENFDKFMVQFKDAAKDAAKQNK